MMFKYKYTGRGTMSFSVGTKQFTVSKENPRLSDTIELPEKVEIAGLELVEEKKEKKSK